MDILRIFADDSRRASVALEGLNMSVRKQVRAVDINGFKKQFTMRKLFFLIVVLGMAAGIQAQECYWVMLSDKQGTTFDPYAYFDSKAIARYQQCGADLYDVSNYPLNSGYVRQVGALATETVGESRWFNAIAVTATPEQVARIERLPFVKEVRRIGGDMQMAGAVREDDVAADDQPASAQNPMLTEQLVRMQGEMFRQAGIDGKGIRIAVFDGGFPHVNTHAAFKHLRDNGQILKTWNFCNRKEDVYGWSTHGTMVLSCIAGILNGRQLGLATGAEFLLARTEINTEPFKEEVWWMQAVEWADKNGADIISSSLGYGTERHYTYEMDGRSYVAHAANMAARKGMLVLCSAGNEGDDDKWKTIVTPSDADSAICVGGIVNNLKAYRHISFSSYGPSADGRLKPNVCAFGHAVVAKPGNDTASTMASGTSFSCPLTAGFAACAWQTHRQLTAMQMKAEIEHSGDLYPYSDYAFGYGVPQASYFVGKREPVKPTFRFEDRGTYIAVVPTGVVRQTPANATVKYEGESKSKAESTTLSSRIEEATNMMYNSGIDGKRANVFMKATTLSGEIERYVDVEFASFDPSLAIAVAKSGLYKKLLTVSYEGYTDSLRLSAEDNRALMDSGNVRPFGYSVIDSGGYLNYSYDERLSRTPEDNKVDEKAWQQDYAFLLGDMVKTQGEEHDLQPWSPAFHFDIRWAKPLKKWYALGFGFGYVTTRYHFDPKEKNDLDKMLDTYTAADSVFGNKRLTFGEVEAELFQRIRITAGGLFKKGLHWDLGVYGSCGWYRYRTQYTDKNLGYVDGEVREYKAPQFNDAAPWNYGVLTRLTYDFFGFYARYRLTGIGDTQIQTQELSPGNFYMNLPRLEVGLQLNL